ncbi:MAG: hypothetical protein ACP5N7_01325 [Candidatus Pacearchaeota archaeon]
MSNEFQDEHVKQLEAEIERLKKEVFLSKPLFSYRYFKDKSEKLESQLSESQKEVEKTQKAYEYCEKVAYKASVDNAKMISKIQQLTDLLQTINEYMTSFKDNWGEGEKVLNSHINQLLKKGE